MRAIPALLKTRFGANEILTSLMLVYVAQLGLDWLARGPWRDPAGPQFPRQPPLRGRPDAAGHPRRQHPAERRLHAGRRRRDLVPAAPDDHRLPDRHARPGAAGRGLRRLQPGADDADHLPDRRRARRTRRHLRGRRSDREAPASASRPATASPRSSSPFSAASIRSASSLPASSWPCPISAGRGCRSPSAYPSRSPACSRACCSSSCWPATPSSSIACAWFAGRARLTQPQTIEATRGDA